MRRSSDRPSDGGKRVTYWGHIGDQHMEWFPGAGPVKPCGSTIVCLEESVLIRAHPWLKK